MTDTIIDRGPLRLRIVLKHFTGKIIRVTLDENGRVVRGSVDRSKRVPLVRYYERGWAIDYVTDSIDQIVIGYVWRDDPQRLSMAAVRSGRDAQQFIADERIEITSIDRV